MKNHENRPGTMKNQPGTMKTDQEPWKTNLEPWKTNMEPWETMKTDLEPWKTNMEPWTTNIEPRKTIKNPPGTMKNHENWPGTMKNRTGELNQIGWTTLIKDFCNNTPVFLQQNFSIFAISFHVPCKLSLSLRLNGTPLVQKRVVTDVGPQLTSFGEKTWREGHGAPTDLLDV